MRQVTFIILDDEELKLCRACPYIANANGNDACYKEDFVGCPHLKEYKEKHDKDKLKKQLDRIEKELDELLVKQEKQLKVKKELEDILKGE